MAQTRVAARGVVRSEGSRARRVDAHASAPAQRATSRGGTACAMPPEAGKASRSAATPRSPGPSERGDWRTEEARNTAATRLRWSAALEEEARELDQAKADEKRRRGGLPTRLSAAARSARRRPTRGAPAKEARTAVGQRKRRASKAAVDEVVAESLAKEKKAVAEPEAPGPRRSGSGGCGVSRAGGRAGCADRGVQGFGIRTGGAGRRSRPSRRWPPPPRIAPRRRRSSADGEPRGGRGTRRQVGG